MYIILLIVYTYRAIGISRNENINNRKDIARRRDYKI